MKHCLLSIVITMAALIPGWSQGTSPFTRGETQTEVILPPSPSPASAVKYADVPFTHSEGMAEYDIPFYTLRGRELSVPIGLHYRSGGIKVDEIAGVAGLGWTLNAGGCITREVMDMPDEFTSTLINHEMPSGTLLQDLVNLTNNNSTLTYLKKIIAHQIDSSPDRYRYSICGLSGSFLIGENDAVIHISGDGVHIAPLRDNTTGAVESFTVTGPDGTVYELSDKEIATHLGTSDTAFTPTGGEADRWEAPTAWYLTSMTSRSGCETAQFIYSSGGTWIRNVDPASKTVTFVEWGSGQSMSTGYVSSFIACSYATRVLSSISLSGYTASFSYATDTGSHSHSVRSWVSAQNFPSRLTGISVTGPGSVSLRSLTVGTSKDIRDGRIVLGSLRLNCDNTLEDRWDFTYKGSFQSISQYSQDWFGYYNASNETSPLPPLLGGDRLVSYNSLCPFDVDGTYGTLSLAHGAPNASVSAYMSMLTADHDGVTTSFAYEGSTAPDGTAVGIRVASITVLDAGAVKHVRRFTYSSPCADGPVQPAASMYTTLSATQGMHGPLNEEYTWTFAIHETPVEDGPSIRETRVHYGMVTEDISEDGISTGNGTSRTKYIYSTTGIRYGNTTTISRFPSGWASYYNSSSYAPASPTPWTGVREGYEDSGPESPALLTRKEEYAWNGNSYSLVSSVEYSYDTASRSSILAEYRAHLVMERYLGGNIQYADIYHYPIWVRTNPGRHPVETVIVGYHASGNDTTVVSTTYAPRSSLEKPLRVQSESSSASGVIRTVAYTYPDTWGGSSPSWVSALVSQHALSHPLKRSYLYSYVPSGGGLQQLETRKEETQEYSWSSINGVQRLFPSLHTEITGGTESWREEIFSRDKLGNVSSLKERGGTPTVVLWSYGGLYPVAVVENAVLNDVVAVLGQTFISALTDATAPTSLQLNNLASLRSYLSNSHVTIYTWLPGKGISSKTNPAGVKTVYEYDAAGRLTTVKDADGYSLESWTYNLLNNGGNGLLSARHKVYRTQTGNVYGEDVRWWNTLGLVKQDIAIGGGGTNVDLVTAYESDFLFHDDVKVWKPYPVNNTSGVFQTGAAAAAASYHNSPLAYTYKEYEMSSRDRMKSSALPGYAGSHETEYADDLYSGFPRLVWVNGSGVVNEGTYAAAELVESFETDADGRRSGRVTDHAGRLLGTLQGTAVPSPSDPAPTYYVYDKLDRLRAVVGSGIALTDTLNMWRYSYDACERLSSKGIPGSIREFYTYDNEDRIVSIIRGDDCIEKEYNDFGDVIKVYLTHGVGTKTLIEEHSYSSGGLEIWCKKAELDGDGLLVGYAEIDFTYDTKARLVSAETDYPDGGTQADVYTYTFSGEVATRTTSYTHGSVTDVLSQSMDYDVRGRLTGVSSSLSASGNTVASGATQYSYDAQGRLAGATSSANGGVTIVSEDSFTLQDGLSTRTVKRAGSNLFAENLTYDGLADILGVGPSYTGMITAKLETWSFPGNVTSQSKEGYTYDFAGRMTRSGTASSPTYYTYDARSNILTAGSGTYSYTGDRLSSFTLTGLGSVSFSYDALGRMTDDGQTGTIIAYNYLDLPRKISQSGTDLVKYSYLADGNKTGAVDGSGTGLVYRGSLTYRKAANGALSLEGADIPEGRLTPNGTRWHVTDHLGSVRAEVDGSNGNLYKVADYDAYGVASANAAATAYLSPTPSGETFRSGFTGQEDQTPDFSVPYTDFGARHYNPALRRWLVPDPLSEKYYGISPYAYCASDPVNLVDPNGKDGIKYIDNNGQKVVETNIVVLTEPLIAIPEDASFRQRVQIERKNKSIILNNNKMIESKREILDRVYNGENGGSIDSSGELVHFVFNVIPFDAHGNKIDKDLIYYLAIRYGLPCNKLGVDTIASSRIIVYSNELLPGILGKHSAYLINLPYGASDDSLPHEIGHSFGLHDTYPSGGLMNYPTTNYLTPEEVDEIWEKAANRR